ncbi:MAG: PMT family glycosyltransferase, 4-amino-4-deoxy-L-arabinose transferase [Candidatus Gottesmanbacteria bacterium GW2011_GWA2_43_14]|uniref:PMT family glycosyltransferase, 4-amino-4-deoxy-L-arabinose transferase n=1 Tax=Candidatus Gottesmanbacteria bacterium GW2011_GWA2_43_14 TaxID=1618443 RepID=A0A0G1DM72_9BACT|nr:MAG: PMT family glycosyltransferase, 4-amino-4-deoxy-L-arabinose transferase [Candidatus Gottesmanbacteria bacterium GW2011_GWA2_43_14]
MELFKRKSFLFLFLILVLSSVARLYRLDSIPGSLYTDEANQGYNAFSLLITGKDEHGYNFPVTLRSFGDWKPPLQSWLMIPFVVIFGLSETSVRLPSAILGTASVYLLYLLVVMLFPGSKAGNKMALIAAWSISVSPWHILQSRSAMLVGIALFFVLFSVIFFLKGVKKNHNIFWSFIFFGISLYAYYGLRVFVPLLILLLMVIYRQIFLAKPRLLLMPMVAICLAVAPLFLGFLTNQDVIFGRARTISVFYDQGVKLRQWELITQDRDAPPVLARFFHNKAYLYFRQISSNFFSHFDGRYLFLKGDTVTPFQIPGMGLLYLTDGFFLITGIVLLAVRFGSGQKKFLFGWLIISLIPASLTFMVPSSNRTFTAIVPLTALIAAGLSIIRDKKTVIAVSAIYIFLIGYFFRQYFISLNSSHSDWWNYGWREAVSETSRIGSKYENIIVADFNGMPYIYFLFYNRYDAGLYQRQAARTYVADRFGFEHVEGFGKYLFPENLDWQQVKRSPLKNSLYILPANLSDDAGYLYEVKDPRGKPLYRFYDF